MTKKQFENLLLYFINDLLERTEPTKIELEKEVTEFCSIFYPNKKIKCKLCYIKGIPTLAIILNKKEEIK